MCIRDSVHVLHHDAMFSLTDEILLEAHDIRAIFAPVLARNFSLDLRDSTLRQITGIN